MLVKFWNRLWWTQVRCAIPLLPGPWIENICPEALLFWKVLWSTSQSSPETNRYLPVPVSWRTLRVIRQWLVPACACTVPMECVNLKPRMTIQAAGLLTMKLAEPLISAPPVVSDEIMIGFCAVPCLLILMVALDV